MYLTVVNVLLTEDHSQLGSSVWKLSGRLTLKLRWFKRVNVLDLQLGLFANRPGSFDIFYTVTKYPQHTHWSLFFLLKHTASQVLESLGVTLPEIQIILDVNTKGDLLSVYIST